MAEDTQNVPKKKVLGIIGIVIGFFALAGAFLYPWIQDAVDPPKKTIEESVGDFAGRLTEAAKAKVKGESYDSRSVSTPKPSRFVVPAIIGVGMVGAGFGLASFLRSETRAYSGGAVALGVGAAVVQWSIILAGAILLIFLVLAVMSLLG